MVQVHKHGVLLEQGPAEFESEGVLNPAVIDHEGKIHMFYRALRTGNRSVIGHANLSDPLTVESRDSEPVIKPEYEYETVGTEDPRIVLIEGTFLLTYTAYDGTTALGALAISQDLMNFQKLGIIVPRVEHRQFAELFKSSRRINRKYFRFDQSSEIIWNKNVVFFPKKIKGDFVFLHRIRPGIQMVRISTLDKLNDEFWQQYLAEFPSKIVLDPKHAHEMSYIGAGCPPIETEEGWLLIYHSVYDTIGGYIYNACAALLDLDQPEKEISRLPYPLFAPDQTWELNGEVDNVCFPTGAIVRDDNIYVYYGAADKRIACAHLNKKELLAELLKYSANGKQITFDAISQN